MGSAVSLGGMCQCTFGVTPTALVFIPAGQMAQNMPLGTIMDTVPMMNIPTFGMCSSPTNPEVATATTAAGGVLTPMPCIPKPAGPWIIGSPTVMMGGKPALSSSSTAVCAYGGSITITAPSTGMTVSVP